MICVVLHLYYIELLDEIHSYLKNIKGDWDIYITVPEDCDPTTESKIKSILPNSRIKRVENRGEDIGAFLNIIQDIDVEKYQYFFKIHTKKNPNWRKDLLQPILSSWNIDNAVNLLSRHKMVGSARWKMDSLSGNGMFYEYWCEKFGYKKIEPDKQPTFPVQQHRRKYPADIWKNKEMPIPHFVAGSIFACTQDIVSEIKSKKISQSEFEFGYKSDLRKEHAFERFFGKIVKEKNSSIAFV